MGWKVVAYVEIGAGPPTGAVADAASVPDPSRAPAVARTCSELAQVDSAFAERSRLQGTPAAFAAAMAPDGITFAGSELVVGPRAERDFLESQRTSLIWHPVYVGAAASGDLGFTVGVYVATGRGSTGAAVQTFGKYLTVWRRDEKGTWKVAADGGNTMPPP
jgi:ketosteroid isomerase-like protein